MKQSFFTDAYGLEFLNAKIQKKNDIGTTPITSLPTAKIFINLHCYKLGNNV